MPNYTIDVNYCDETGHVNVAASYPSDCLINGRAYNINALGGNLVVPFKCCVNSVSSSLQYTLGNNLITFNIPRNNTSSDIIHSAIIEYCDESQEDISISQSRFYEKWVQIPIDEDYICDDCEDYKLHITYADGEDEYILCNGTTTLTSGDVRHTRDAVSAEVGECITSIGNNAFANCIGLEDVVIPDSVTTISNGAFKNCHSLSGISIPSSVTTVGDEAFLNCHSITAIDLTYVTSVGARAYQGCYNIERLLIPNTATTFGTDALTFQFNDKFDNPTSGHISFYKSTIASIYERSKLNYFYLNNNNFFNMSTVYAPYYKQESVNSEELVIGESVTTIPREAFLLKPLERTVSDYGRTDYVDSYAYRRLKRLSIPNVQVIGQSAFYSIPPFGKCNTEPIELIEMNSLTTIGDNAFEGITIGTVKIGSGITRINNKSFECKTLIIESETPPVISGTLKVTRSVVIPASSYSLYKSNQYWSGYTLCNDTIIKQDSFAVDVNRQDDAYITARIIPYNVYTPFIDYDVFFGDDDDEDSDVEDIQYGCDGMTSYTIPSGVTSIRNSAFYGCTSLVSITIPSGVTSIGRYAFSDCSNLRKVIFEEGSLIESIGYACFAGCSSLESITIPSGVTQMGVNPPPYVTPVSMFGGCDSLKTIIMEPITPPSIICGLTSSAKVMVNGEAYSNYASNSTWSRYNLCVDSKCLINGNLYIPLNGSSTLTENEITTSISKTAITSVEIFHTVDTLANGLFSGCTNLMEVFIPDSITEIPTNAFKGCPILSSVTIPYFVDTIGDYAFSGCPSMYKFEFNPLIAPTLGNGVFDDTNECVLFVPKSSLSSYQTKEGYSYNRVRAHAYFVYNNGELYDLAPLANPLLSVHSIEIGDLSSGLTTSFYARYNYSASTTLTSVTVPYYCNVQTNHVSGAPFAYTSNLKRVIIDSPNCCFGFSNCPHLDQLVIGRHLDRISCLPMTDFNTVDRGNTTYDSRENCNAIIETSSNTLVHGGSATTIPNSVTSIGNSAFAGSRLTSITIPNSVTSIGNSAFAGSRLTSITIPNSVTYVADDAFYGCTNLPIENYVYYADYIAVGVSDNGWETEWITSYPIKNGTKLIGYKAFYNLTQVTSMSIPSSVERIGNSSFAYCTGLTSIAIPNSVTSIGNSAFFGCSSLTRINIPDSVTSIGGSAFNGCISLTSVAVNSNVALNGAFSGLSSITEVIIGDSVTTIGNSAFTNCYSLASINIPSGVTSIGGSSFAYCTGLTSIAIPNSVTSIGDRAFYECRNLTTINNIPNSVTSIGNSAFTNCYSLTSISIPSNITNIGDGVFTFCTSLTSITIPSSVTSIGDNALRNCESLTNITIPNSVTSIGKNAFSDCYSLTSITIPSGVTSIGASAFTDCTSLTSITCLSTTPPTLGHFAFEYTNDCPIYVPSESVSAYQSDWSWDGYLYRIEPIPTP